MLQLRLSYRLPSHQRMKTKKKRSQKLTTRATKKKKSSQTKKPQRSCLLNALALELAALLPEGSVVLLAAKAIQGAFQEAMVLVHRA